MGLLLEDRSKDILNRNGITIPDFITATTALEACEKSLDLAFPVSLKVLVVGKNGSVNRVVRHASRPEELQAIAALIFSRDIANRQIERIMVQEKPDVHKSLYLKFCIDYISHEYQIQVGLLDGAGSNRKTDFKPIIERLNPMLGLKDGIVKRIWSKAGLDGPELFEVCQITINLFSLFTGIDANFIELNPLVFSKQGTLIAEHSTISIDDNAMFRHPELEGLVEIGAERLGRFLSNLEKHILQLDMEDNNQGTIHLVEIDGGDIGFMCGGGGNYMLFDSLLKFGGRPANYSEFCGNPNSKKISGLTKAILSKQGVRGLFLAQNITSNTQLDTVAQAVVESMKDLAIDLPRFPVVVRQSGANEEKAREIFVKAGIEYYGDEITLVKAARRMVEKMSEAYPGYSEEGYLNWQY